MSASKSISMLRWNAVELCLCEECSQIVVWMALNCHNMSAVRHLSGFLSHNSLSNKQCLHWTEWKSKQSESVLNRKETNFAILGPNWWQAWDHWMRCYWSTNCCKNIFVLYASHWLASHPRHWRPTIADHNIQMWGHNSTFSRNDNSVQNLFVEIKNLFQVWN